MVDLEAYGITIGDGDIDFGEFGVRGFEFGRKMNIDV